MDIIVTDAANCEAIDFVEINNCLTLDDMTKEIIKVRFFLYFQHKVMLLHNKMKLF